MWYFKSYLVGFKPLWIENPRLKAQKRPLGFLFLKAWNQKSKHPLEETPKKHKQIKENPKKQNFEVKPSFPFPKMLFFFVFWLYVAMSWNLATLFVLLPRAEIRLPDNQHLLRHDSLYEISISLKTCVSTSRVQCLCTYLTFGYSDWK